jgi:hypothetical protein
MLKFTIGNSKLTNGTAIFSLPAGHSCPFAKDCKASADRVTGKLTDGPHTQFRCYAASLENIRPNVRNLHFHNFDVLRKTKSISEMVSLISNCLPHANLVRIHASGDFYSQSYFDAWLQVARLHPTKTFYAYTKALPFWVKRLNEIPANLHLNASYGGTHDKLIETHCLKSVRVVYSEEEAEKLGLELDFDDTHAWQSDACFALLLHGTQPANSVAAKAWYQIRMFGHGGYGPKKKEIA